MRLTGASFDGGWVLQLPRSTRSIVEPRAVGNEQERGEHSPISINRCDEQRRFEDAVIGLLVLYWLLDCPFRPFSEGYLTTISLEEIT
jgi:hypothetical protein